jgi:DNA helicase II / ATP-dependent DNA helicase PcrA
MGKADNEWIEEQQRVNEVTDLIAVQIDQLEEQIGYVKNDVVDIRKHFWDEVSVDFSSMDDVIETAASLKQQAEVLSERERSHRHAVGTHNKLTRLVQSPYFGRIDFVENGETGVEQVYLGIGSFLNESGDTFLIYDWRAPISSLYYDYSPGDAEYNTPAVSVKGNMLLKRQFVIRDRKIQIMFDTGVTIGDQLLQQVLSRSSDAQMKSIVATIQKEQNRIIRNDHSRMLIVQGAAGSGKTSSALQRVAYLLYKNRETLKSDQMVLFSPNPMFNSYVSTVLPELGEENMQQTTFQAYLEHRLGMEYQLEDPFNQLEYVLESNQDPDYNARISGIHYKSSFTFMQVILKYKAVLEHKGMKFSPVSFMGKDIITAKQMVERFYAYDSSIRLTNRLILLRDWLLKELKAFERTQLDADWVEDEIDLLEPEDYHRAYEKLRRMQEGRGVTFDDFEAERVLLARVVVQERLKPIRDEIKRLSFVDVKAIYQQLFENGQEYVSAAEVDLLPEYWTEICERTLSKLKQSELDYEDATPYLFLQDLLLGFQVNTSVRHVIVDEAQDYSPFQLEYLKRLFPRSRMTALGDYNQAIYAHSSAMQSFDPLTQLYGEEQTELIQLLRCYRSTLEIVEFTRGMVPGGEHIVPFNRKGDKPVIRRSMNINEMDAAIRHDIEKMQAEGYESIAVICKTASEAANVHAELNKELSVRLVTKFTPTFEQGVLVIPAYLAKGVEFDAVIIYNGSSEHYRHESERKLFYTACTRAMHLLHIHAAGDLSPFITSQNSDTYHII